MREVLHTGRQHTDPFEADTLRSYLTSNDLPHFVEFCASLLHFIFFALVNYLPCIVYFPSAVSALGYEDRIYFLIFQPLSIN
ncbi:hypothetical protein DSUL_20430 [Desulfovibrionales bacterium]